MTSERAKILLERFGIMYEYEPAVIAKGKNPDFYCFGDSEFWSEVKTLGPPGELTHLGTAHVELRERINNNSLPEGRGIAHVNGNLNPRDARAVILLLGRSLGRFKDLDSPERVVSLIPCDPIYGNFVRFSISTKEYSNVEFHSLGSTEGKYGIPHEMFPESYSQMMRLQFSTGEEENLPADSVLTFTDNFRVAIVAQPDGRPFHLLATVPTGMAKKLTNSERIREALSEANSQFKNAVKYRELPCLLIIFQDGIDVPDESIIRSALYGDLKYRFSPDRFDDGELVLEGKGAWNPDKNRTTSAVMFIRNEGEPIIVHNRWAYRPLRRGVLSCKEIVLLDNGVFQEI